MKLGFLFNASDMGEGIVDYSYKEEYDVLKNRGVRVFTFDLGKLGNSDMPLIEKSEEKMALIYRGWMLNEFQYDALSEALEKLNYTLIVDPYQYRECHYLDYWYTKVKDLTAKSIYSHGLVSDEKIGKMLDKFSNHAVIVKDYVKSRKHEWYESCFIEDASDRDEALKVIHNFTKRQGDNFSGGLVLREYLDVKKTGVHYKSHMPISEEVRIFCYKNDPICYISYWTGDMWQMDKSFLDIIDQCAILESPFYTLDLARTNDNKWVLIEVGDGQVSHLRGYSAERFYDAFLSLLSRDYEIYA